MKATKVKNAYMKKKDPLFVRESLLNAAFELAAAKGMADVTVTNVDWPQGFFGNQDGFCKTFFNVFIKLFVDLGFDDDLCVDDIK